MQKCRFYPHTHNNSYPLVPLGGFPTLYPFPSSFPSLLSLTISVASQRKKIIFNCKATRHHIGEVTQVVQPSGCWFPILHIASPLLQSLSQASQVFIILKTHPGKDGCCIWRQWEKENLRYIFDSFGGGVISLCLS